MNDTIQHSNNTLLPRYGSRPTKPGMYLSLFHGRNSPTEEMDGWGFNGPMIGPLRWCHTTYACDVKIEFETAADAVTYFGKDRMDTELQIDADMLVYDGKYYGDWTVHYVPPDECARPPDGFRPVPRNNYCLAHRKSLSQRFVAGILRVTTEGTPNGHSTSALDKIAHALGISSLYAAAIREAAPAQC